MTTGEIILAIMAALNAAAFMYWMHVDSKMTARIDQLYIELINMKKQN